MSEPISRHGEWWQEKLDGTWLRWDDKQKTWRPEPGPPPPPPPEKKPFDLPPPVEWVIEKSTVILALVALVIYGFVRVTTDQFYAQLYVTPEEIGLNHALIIGRAALYSVLLIAFLLSVGGAWVGSTIGLIKGWWPDRSGAFHFLSSVSFLLFVLPPLLILDWESLWDSLWRSERRLTEQSPYPYLRKPLAATRFLLDRNEDTASKFRLVLALIAALVFLILWSRRVARRRISKTTGSVERTLLCFVSLVSFLIILISILTLVRWEFPHYMWKDNRWILAKPMLLIAWLFSVSVLVYWTIKAYRAIQPVPGNEGQSDETVESTQEVEPSHNAVSPETDEPPKRSQSVVTDEVLPPKAVTGAPSASRIQPSQNQLQLSQAETAFIIALVAFVVVSALLMSARYGYRLSQDFKTHDEPTLTRPFGFKVLSIHADPVCLQSVEATPSDAVKRYIGQKFIYLGQSDQTLVLYDASRGKKRPLRIPAGKVSIDLVIDGAHCPSASVSAARQTQPVGKAGKRG